MQENGGFNIPGACISSIFLFVNYESQFPDFNNEKTRLIKERYISRRGADPLNDGSVDDPNNEQGKDGDLDHDGWTNFEEYERGTDPNDADSHPSKAMPWLQILLLDD